MGFNQLPQIQHGTRGQGGKRFVGGKVALRKLQGTYDAQKKAENFIRRDKDNGGGNRKDFLQQKREGIYDYSRNGPAEKKEGMNGRFLTASSRQKAPGGKGPETGVIELASIYM